MSEVKKNNQEHTLLFLFAIYGSLEMEEQIYMVLD